jgi:hypothetical protein
MKTITSIREVGNELINPIVTNSKHSSLSIAPTETQTMRQFLQESLVARSSTVGGQGSNKTKSFFLTVYLFVFVSPVTKWKNTRSTPALFDNSPLRCKSSDSTRSGYRAHSNCRVQTGFIRLVDEEATRRPLPDKRQNETCANRTLQRERGKSPTGGRAKNLNQLHQVLVIRIFGAVFFAEDVVDFGRGSVGSGARVGHLLQNRLASRCVNKN